MLCRQDRIEGCFASHRYCIKTKELITWQSTVTLQTLNSAGSTVVPPTDVRGVLHLVQLFLLRTTKTLKIFAQNIKIEQVIRFETYTTWQLNTAFKCRLRRYNKTQNVNCETWWCKKTFWCSSDGEPSSDSWQTGISQNVNCWIQKAWHVLLKYASVHDISFSFEAREARTLKQDLWCTATHQVKGLVLPLPVDTIHTK